MNDPVPIRGHSAAPIHTLMMVARSDEMVHCNRSVQDIVFEKIAAPKALYEIDGGHFGLLWSPGPLFDEAAAQQTKFLRDLLPV